MPQFRHLTEVRLREILRRQDPPVFGHGYEASIKPTRTEAPSRSRPAWVWSQRLGRRVSTLSQPERDVFCILDYHPGLFELQEQRMLPFLPTPHPFAGHHLAAGLVLPAVRGTLAVAHDLGVLNFHPVLRSGNQAQGEPLEAVPAPFINDFLAFFYDTEGCYCLNLSVKATKEAFTTKTIGVTPRTNMQRAQQREAARHAVEEKLFLEIGIPTHFLASSELHPIAVANLQNLQLWQKRPQPFDQSAYQKIVDAFQNGMVQCKSGLEVIHCLKASQGQREYDIRVTLHHAIWRRDLRIDLFSYFFIDRPLIPEKQDVLELYGHWFERMPS